MFSDNLFNTASALLIGLSVVSSFAVPTIAASSDLPVMEPDSDSWGSTRELSQKQVEFAIQHYADHDPCLDKSWRWVLIGKGELLLAGTHYRVVNRHEAMQPNISIVKGFWGGTPHFAESIDKIKHIAEMHARNDCATGVVP